jgi:hypothetical protein
MANLRARLAALERRAAARRVSPRAAETLTRIKADPAAVLTLAGMPPDPWQRALVRSRAERVLVLASRQVGKSQTSAAVAVAELLTRSNATVLVTGPSVRQSGECFRKGVDLFDRLGQPLRAVRRGASFLELANGSRLLAVPGNEKTIRGFSAVALVIVDEAARVPDGLLTAVRPMLAVGGGRLMAVSTPFGKRGWFFNEWTGQASWERVRVRADECPTQEYLCSFEEATDAVFSTDDILAAATDEAPLFATAA